MLFAENLPIPGLILIHLDQHFDSRGWFEESWHGTKFEELGISNFHPCQSNISFNAAVGTTRGMHAEPWNKLITVSSGSAFCAWVDLRPGKGFLRTFALELGPGQSVLVPMGVANGFQTTKPNTVYTYLVDGNWSEDSAYKTLNAFDPKLNIAWPLEKSKATYSAKDEALPFCNEVMPYDQEPVVVLGTTGQLGAELYKQFPHAQTLTTLELKQYLEDGTLVHHIPSGSTLINAAAYTNVDGCETEVGYAEAIQANFKMVKTLADIANLKKATLVHFSSDFVFNGAEPAPYTEDDSPDPINRYGFTKMLGDLAAQRAKKHYIFRVSWLYGGGSNFVDKVAKSLKAGKTIEVVSDQFGVPTSAKNAANSVKQVLIGGAKYGTYNLTDSGPFVSRFELAQEICSILNLPHSRILEISSSRLNAKFPSSALRPRNSKLSLEKILQIVPEPETWKNEFRNYLLSDS